MFSSKVLLVFLLLLSGISYSQSFQVLHYSETSGYDHQTRQGSLSMLQNLGGQNNFTVDDDQTGAAFDTLSNLQKYAVIVFSNTSGNAILDSAQRANFEAYLNNGGALVGIHAASDTYRHSTANGTKTGTWDWYAETLGGSVQEAPNHTAANHSGTMDHIGNHPTTRSTPNPWNKVEEYYYWENGYLNPNINSVLQVKSTGSNSYDAARPMSWFQNLVGGGRSFYTALGHANSNFISDTAFHHHIRDAILWAAGRFISLQESQALTTSIFPNPVKGKLTVEVPKGTSFSTYQIVNPLGKVVQKGTLSPNKNQNLISVERLPSGSYFLYLQSLGLDLPSPPLRFSISP